VFDILAILCGLPQAHRALEALFHGDCGVHFIFDILRILNIKYYLPLLLTAIEVMINS
jgi:hypothetical protein